MSLTTGGNHGDESTLPLVAKIRRVLKAVDKAGERVERVEVDAETNNFTVIIAKRDTPQPDDLIEGKAA